jgi:hypothetical protein
VSDPGLAGTASSAEPANTATEPREQGHDSDYDPAAKVGAILLSIFLPLIAIIAALVLRGSEHSPRRRQFLKWWAIGTAGWMCSGFVIALVGFISLLPGAAGCQGGINRAVPPSFTSSDGQHWTAVYTCMNGGTMEKPAPPGSVP